MLAKGLPMIMQLLGGSGGGLGGLFGGGGNDQAAEAQAQRHHQIMTMLAMGAQRQGLGGRKMMRQLWRTKGKLHRMKAEMRRKKRERRRRRNDLMRLRHEPYWSVAPPRRRFHRPPPTSATKVHSAEKFYY